MPPAHTFMLSLLMRKRAFTVSQMQQPTSAHVILFESVMRLLTISNALLEQPLLSNTCSNYFFG